MKKSTTELLREHIDSIDPRIVIENENPAERLSEIKEEIKELMHEVKSLLGRNDGVWARAKAYWYAHIITALDKEHDYMGSSMTTMQDTINELGGPMDMEAAVEAVEHYMNEGKSLEDAVREVSDSSDANYNELMAAVQHVMNGR